MASGYLSNMMKYELILVLFSWAVLQRNYSNIQRDTPHNIPKKIEHNCKQFSKNKICKNSHKLPVTSMSWFLIGKFLPGSR
jgi:hypothetical protein